MTIMLDYMTTFYIIVYRENNTQINIHTYIYTYSGEDEGESRDKDRHQQEFLRKLEGTLSNLTKSNIVESIKEAGVNDGISSKWKHIFNGEPGDNGRPF